MDLFEKLLKLLLIIIIIIIYLFITLNFDICFLSFHLASVKTSIDIALIELISPIILALTLIATIKYNTISRIERFYETLISNINDARFENHEGINAYINFNKHYEEENKKIVNKVENNLNVKIKINEDIHKYYNEFKRVIEDHSSDNDSNNNIFHNLYDSITNVITTFESYISYIDDSFLIGSNDKVIYKKRFYLLFYEKMFWILKSVYVDNGIILPLKHDDSLLVVKKFNDLSKEAIEFLIKHNSVVDSDNKKGVINSINEFLKSYNKLYNKN